MSPFVWLVILVVTRLLPVAVLVPSAFTTRQTWRWSLACVVVLTTVVLPSQTDGAGVPDLVGARPIIDVAGELLVGLALGTGFVLLLAALQVSAVVLTSMAGLTNLFAVSAEAGGGASPWQRYFGLLTLALFLVSGGQRHMIEALMTSFSQLPPGTPLPAEALTGLLAGALTDAFCLGVRAAAPVGFCLIVAAIFVAVLGRSSPALGTFGLGIAVNSLVLLLVTWASLGTVATVYQQHWSDGVERMMESFRPDSSSTEARND